MLIAELSLKQQIEEVSICARAGGGATAVSLLFLGHHPLILSFISQLYPQYLQSRPTNTSAHRILRDRMYRPGLTDWIAIQKVRTYLLQMSLLLIHFLNYVSMEQLSTGSA